MPAENQPKPACIRDYRITLTKRPESRHGLVRRVQ